MATELIPLENPKPSDLFAPKGLDRLISQIEKDARALVPDMETSKGRDAIKSMAAKVARSKTYLDALGKDHVAGLKAQAKAVDEVRRDMRTRLDSLRDEIRKPVTEWEKAEAERQAELKRRMSELKRLPENLDAAPAKAVRNWINEIDGIAIGDDWQELKDEAEQARAATLYRLGAALKAAENREAAEAERKAREEAERAERERRITEEAAEQARLEAERKAEAERQEAERKRKAEQEAREQEERRAQAEREGLAAEQERQRLEAIREKEEAERRAHEAEAAAKREAKEAKARAERERLEAAERQQAAIEAERKRIADEARAKAKADEARAKDRANRADKHNAMADALIALDAGLTADQAKAVVKAIASGTVPHVTITY